MVSTSNTPVVIPYPIPRIGSAPKVFFAFLARLAVENWRYGVLNNNINAASRCRARGLVSIFFASRKVEITNAPRPTRFLATVGMGL